MQQPTLSLGLVQLRCALGERGVNLERAEALLATLEGRAQIACLPELFDVGYALDELGDRHYALAETVPGPTTERLGRHAGRLHMALVGGLLERDARVPEVLFDTTVVFDTRGSLVGRYRKSHLYPAEHRYFRPGSELPVFDVGPARLGIATCFELAFPPVVSTLARRGATLVLNPSAVPVGYAYLQDLRTRARAQDNQIFVAAVNHVGREGGVTYCGGSLVADPRGAVLLRASETEEGAWAVELPLELIEQQRRQEPVFRGFRPELYEF